MTLIRRPSLFPELEPLRDVADRLFDERSWWPLWAVERGREMVPPLDLYSTPEAIIAKVALAGVKPEDVDVKITDEFVTIEGKFEEEKETTDAGAVQREIGHGLFTRRFFVPTPIKAGEAKAVFQDGLLTLTLPKKQRELPAKHVKVEVESAAEAADLGAMGGPVVPRGCPPCSPLPPRRSADRLQNGHVRGHELLAHTADAGFRARAATLPELFAEAARALTDVAGGAPVGEPQAWIDVELEAGDLPGLAYAWLNELIGLSEIHRRSVVATDVDVEDVQAGGWALRGRVGLAAAGAGLRQVKSATYHRLSVERRGGAWTMEAYLDI